MNSFIIGIVILISIILGYITGYIIANYTKEEVKKGKNYLEILQVVIFFIEIYFLAIYFKTKDNESLVVIISLLFLLFIPIGSLGYLKKD